MNALITVWAKELTDLFRDRRTMMVSLLMGPLLMPALILGIGKLASDRVTTQLEKPLEVPVIGASNAPNLVAWLDGQNIVVKPAPADADAAIRSQREDVILRIDARVRRAMARQHAGNGRDPARQLTRGRADPGRALAQPARQLRPRRRRAAAGRARHQPDRRASAADQRSRPGDARSASRPGAWRSCPTC